MKVCVIGAGGIGSTFALLLSRAGHEVCVVARGARLEELRSEGALASFPEDVAFDLVLVTVLAHQVQPLLPSLKASAAKSVMFMFNTFGGLDVLRDAVGAQRFAFGFPAIIARVENGVLSHRVVSGLQTTTVGGAQAEQWARVFSEAGVPTVVHHDIDSWLRTHAAFMAPLMLLGCDVHAQKQGVSWRRARALANQMHTGFALVKNVTPTSMRVVRVMPRAVMTFALWVLSRLPIAKNLGLRGDAEAKALISQMNAARSS